MRDYTNHKILVTGASGFVGSYVCKKLVADGYKVLGASHYGDTYRIQSLMGNNNFTLKIGDIRDNEFVKGLCVGITTIFHLAAQVPYAKEEKDFSGINSNGTLNLLRSAYFNGVKEFIYASSMSVYSLPVYLPVDEDHPTQPVDMYGRTKLSGELCCKSFSDAMRVVILRFAGVYGANSDKSRVIPLFIRSALADEPITLDGDGRHSSDFVFVEDVVQGIILAWGRGRGIYNIGSGRETKLAELAEMIVNATASKSQIKLKNNYVERPPRFWLDISKAKKELGYSPTILEHGLGVVISAHF